MLSFIEGLLAGYGIAIPLGAIGILIFGMGVRCGFRIGFMAGAGAATADLLYAILASAAGTVAVTLLAPIALPLRLTGGLVLVGLAAAGLWQGAHPSSQVDKTAEVCGPTRMYMQFLGLTIINPMTVIYFTAFILGRDAGAARLSLLPQLLFVVGVGLASLSWQSLLAGLGHVAGGRLSPRFRFSAIVVGNLIVLGLGLQILATSTLRGG
jgi:arginine exporter protein ArgO